MPSLTPRRRADPKKGFADHKDFLTAVIENGNNQQPTDERLAGQLVKDVKGEPAPGGPAFLMPRAFSPGPFYAAAGSDEQGAYSAPFGGYAVGERVTILRGGARNVPTDPTAGRTQPVEMGAPVVKVLARNDSDHTDSFAGGITVSRKPETVPADSSRAEFEMVKLGASSITGLAYAAEEVLQDSTVSFTGLLGVGFADQYGAVVANEKIRGLGGNEMLGVTTALASSGLGPTLSITRDTSSRILGTDVISMRSRCWGYGDAIWLANPQSYPELVRTAGVEYDAAGATPISGAAVPLYQHARAGEEADTLAGRPIFYTELASALGSLGDLILGNWSQYLEGTYQPLQSAESIHVRYVNHERTFKFWVRNAGAPWWRVPLTPKYGASTLSPFVVLAA